MEVLHDLPYYYRQLEGTDILSSTLASNEIHTPLQIPARTTASEDRYQELRQANPQSRLPWGTEREYGAMIPISLPVEHRPKSEPPPFFGKGHKHYGFGGEPWPRGVPIERFYHLTQNKKSTIYENDSLLPKPPSTTAEQLDMVFPVKHPYHTHISQCNLFPSFISPKEANTGIPAKAQQPFPATVASMSYDTNVLKKTKGNPYRHERLDYPPDSQKKALHWPGQKIYYNMPRCIHKNTQIYYPKPPKLLAPNTTLSNLDPLYSLREANLQRNLERSHWITSYTHDFTGLGTMNPLELDDFHEKEVANLTGQIEFDRPPQEKYHTEFFPARPWEGRIARLLHDRRPLESVVSQRLPLCPDCTCSTLCVVHAAMPSHAEMMLVKGGTPEGPVLRQCQVSEIEEMIRERLLPTNPHAFPPDCKTREALDYFSKIYEPNPYPKITDTPKNDALYWRQLCIRPMSEPCLLPQDFMYYDDLKPSQIDQYIVWNNPVSLNKPSFIPDMVESQCIPLHNFICEPQEIVQTPEPGTTPEDQEPLLQWIPNAGHPRPQTCLMDMQDSFTKTDAHRRFHETFVQDHKDLRDNEHLGKKHNFYNYNAYYFFN